MTCKIYRDDTRDFAFLRMLATERSEYPRFFSLERRALHSEDPEYNGQGLEVMHSWLGLPTAAQIAEAFNTIEFLEEGWTEDIGREILKREIEWGGWWYSITESFPDIGEAFGIPIGHIKEQVA